MRINTNTNNNNKSNSSNIKIWRLGGKKNSLSLSYPLRVPPFAQLDNLRDKYGMRTTKMASLFAELIFSDKKSKGYWRLKSYTDPERNPSPVRRVSISDFVTAFHQPLSV